MLDFVILEKILLAGFMGGLICIVIQIFIDKTKLTPARILVSLVVFGVFLYGVGAYEPLFEMFGCGVSVPLLGFGATIARGVKEAIMTDGALGILTGGLTATAAGITTALVLGLLYSLIGRGRPKRIGNVRKR